MPLQNIIIIITIIIIMMIKWQNISSSIDLIEFPPHNHDHQHHILICLKKIQRQYFFPPSFSPSASLTPTRLKTWIVLSECTVYCIVFSQISQVIFAKKKLSCGEILGIFAKFWEIFPRFTRFHVEKNVEPKSTLVEKNDKYEV